MESQGHIKETVITFNVFAEYTSGVDIFLVLMQMHCDYQAGRDTVTLHKGEEFTFWQFRCQENRWIKGEERFSYERKLKD